jgi:hypothetical protein
VSIVGPTTKLDVVRRGFAPDREGIDVVELEVAPALASSTARGDEGALPAVPDPDDALDGGGDVARPIRLATALPRRVRRRELPARQVLHQQSQRSPEDSIQVAARDAIAEEIL